MKIYFYNMLGGHLMKPIIGITSQYEYSVGRNFNKINYTYIEAVIRGGGVPIILPILSQLDDLDIYIDSIDGLILTGGEDVSPLIFGEEPIKEVKNICYDRDQMEIELFNRAYERGIPVLGICRGVQVFNVALGGTLYQDIHAQIPDALGHVSTYNIEGGYHSIIIDKDTMLYDIFKQEKISVNSQHHQSVKDLGRDLRISAKSLDGVIEGVESTTDKYVLGLQFHPEAMINPHKKFLNIFNHFIKNCSSYRT